MATTPQGVLGQESEVQVPQKVSSQLSCDEPMRPDALLSAGIWMVIA